MLLYFILTLTDKDRFSHIDNIKISNRLEGSNPPNKDKIKTNKGQLPIGSQKRIIYQTIISCSLILQIKMRQLEAIVTHVISKVHSAERKKTSNILKHENHYAVYKARHIPLPHPTLLFFPDFFISNFALLFVGFLNQKIINCHSGCQTITMRVGFWVHIF
jgi:hypothetical protein